MKYLNLGSALVFAHANIGATHRTIYPVERFHRVVLFTREQHKFGYSFWFETPVFITDEHYIVSVPELFESGCSVWTARARTYFYTLDNSSVAFLVLHAVARKQSR